MFGACRGPLAFVIVGVAVKAQDIKRCNLNILGGIQAFWGCPFDHYVIFLYTVMSITRHFETTGDNKSAIDT